ncbi:hypothetical protein ACFE04_005197 [Oxalis oulophora]
MKRTRDDQNQIDTMTMVNCLRLLSKVGAESNSSSNRMFECKTCNRQFPSFQALGGHRASHKKPKVLVINGEVDQQESASPKKAKTTHECSICGIEFAIGQALGGHMRRHRAEMTTMTSSGESTGVTRTLLRPEAVVPVMKKSNSSIKRVWGLDLNLALANHYDLELQLSGKGSSSTVPVVDCFY